MESTTKILSSRLPGNLYAPELAGKNATYRFDVTGAGSLFIACDGGHLHVVDGGEADAVFVCDEADFIDVVLGKRNLFTAVLQGRVQVRGDISQAIRLGGAFARAGASRRGETAVAP